MGQVLINIRFKVRFSKYKNITQIMPLAKNGDIVSVLTHDHRWVVFVLILFMRPLVIETKIMGQAFINIRFKVRFSKYETVN